MARIRKRLFLLAAVASVLVGAGAALLSVRKDAPVDGPAALEGTQRGGREERSSARVFARPADLPAVRLSLSPAQQAIPGLSLDPTSPDYDARKLIKLTGDLKAVYEAEPRNRPWAEAVESRVGQPLEQAMRELHPGISGLKMQCRSTMCEIRWDLSTDGDGNESKAQYLALQLFPGYYSPTPDFRGHVIRWDDRTWTGDLRDTDAFIERAKAKIDSATARLRSRDLSSMAPAPSLQNERK
jgi:hypothetical protein